MKFVKVDIKYKLPFKGKYTRLISVCPHCGYDSYHHDLFSHFIGFYESAGGLLFVAECPYCFEKWSAHAGTDDASFYYYFLRCIKKGESLHFDKKGNKKES